MADPHALAGFARDTFTHDGISHEVYKGGTGPCVVVIHEIPGLHPGVISFARRVTERGCSVWMPSLFGTPGRPYSAGYAARSLAGACVAREFTLLAIDTAGPVTGWLRALAAEAHAACGGPGVGAVGMCFTGGFALGMAVDEHTLAPVLSQPSMPVALGARRSAALQVDDDDRRRLAARAAEGLCVMGLRFSDDKLVPPARFDALRDLLGDAFIAVELDSSTGNPWGIPRRAHSVLAIDFVDEPGHPTVDAMERVLDFLDQRLH